jgi:hypothetical protein
MIVFVVVMCLGNGCVDQLYVHIGVVELGPIEKWQ